MLALVQVITYSPQDSTCDQDDAENGSPLQTDPGALPVHPARPGVYKMPPPPFSLSVSSQLPSSLIISNPQTANRPCEPCYLCFQIPSLVVYSGSSKWHLNLLSWLRELSTNTGPIPFFAKKLEPGWNIFVALDGYLQTSNPRLY